MTTFGPFAVTAERARVEAFRAATGASPADAVPATFPMVWLAAPPVSDALLGLAAEPGLVPVHESQSFDYAAPLAIGERYAMTVTARRESAPDRLVVDAQVSDAAGMPRLRAETILRLFSTAGAAGA